MCIVFDVQAFNGMIICLWGFMELIVMFIEGGDTKTIDYHILVVSCKSVYNYILKRSFDATLNIIAYHVYFKIKYHNLHDEPVIIYVNLLGVWSIPKALQRS